MKFFITLWLVCFFHGGDVATFTISKTDTTIAVLVKMETASIAKALHTKAETINEAKLQAYLNTHMKHIINGKMTSAVVEKMTFKNDHICVETTLNGEYSSVKSLEIENTVLFEAKQHQINVIHLRFDDVSRDFSTHKNRPKLDITL